jgi:glycosyltransferase involved in cell wall biosynthesis
MNFGGLRLGLVGPLPPPAGGMANQTQQLGELLRLEGADVTLVQVNARYRPQWIEIFRGVRALFRLVPYLVRLWSVAGRVDMFHVMANSGWSWHLFATPAVWMAKLRGIPSVVNYRGGEAESFLERSGSLVLRTMRCATVIAVPSAFLQQVFRQREVQSTVVPNIVDTERFRPAAPLQRTRVPHLVVARNLESIYDIATALRAFSLVRAEVPGAMLTVAGSGPEREALRSLADELGIAEAVNFRGRLDRDQMAELYRSASVVVNPSRVDNMPNSVLEAMASGAVVVSTNVGGVPFIVRDGVTGLLVAAGDHTAMAAMVRRVLDDPQLASKLREAALADIQQYTWARVRQQWADVYASVLSGAHVEVLPT